MRTDNIYKDYLYFDKIRPEYILNQLYRYNSKKFIFNPIKNKKYAILKDSPKARTGQLFDYETYVQFGNLEFVGLLEMNNENKLVLRLKK